MNNVNLLTRLAVGLIAASLHGAVAAQGVPNSPAFTDVAAETTALNSKFLRVGTNVPLPRILSVQRGLSEAQVGQLLGQPVAVSSSNGSAIWEYHFSLPLADARDSLVCQFIVKFDSATRVVEGTYWRRPQCQALAGTTVNFSADVLFGFNQYQLSDSGKADLETILAGLRQQGGPFSLTVLGHSDRLGDAAYNQRLSERRAQSAAQYLISRGVPRAAISARGLGEAEPLVVCEGNLPSAALTQCLAPNRRISIHIKTAAN